MRVPFIAAWAKADRDNPHQKRLPIAAGAIQSSRPPSYDLFPTILRLADAAAPPNHAVDGARLDTLLAGQPDPVATGAVSHALPARAAPQRLLHLYRDGDWKVIYHTLPETETAGGHIQSGGENYQLFHLAEDPFEQTDLAKSRPEELRRMMTGLIGQLKAHQAVYPVDQAGTALMPKLP